MNAINMTSVGRDVISIDMETMNERLRWARKRAGFKSARKAALSMGMAPSTYAAHDNGQNNFFPSWAKSYGKHFNVSWMWLLHGTGSPEPSDEEMALYETMHTYSPPEMNEQEPADRPRPKSTPNASFPPVYQKFAEGRIPLRGQTVGGPNGRFILNGQDIGSVFCPPDLAGVEGAYAVQVYGTSMEPKFEAGETVWLHPWAPVRTGDYVVVQILTDNGELPESYIKQYVSKSSKVLRLKQFNPEEGESKDLEFDAGKVFSIHKIVFHALV